MGEDLKNDGKEAAHVDRKTYEEAVTLHSDTVTRLLLLRCRRTRKTVTKKCS